MSSQIDTHFWSDRRVFVTGHTGFKGAWLSAWLVGMGARVYGYSLPPEYPRSPYELACVKEHVEETLDDIRNRGALESALKRADPHVVFHLAAQPLVRRSYFDPVGTMMTNIMGTVHLLEGLMACPSLEAAVIVTTDKCYENLELETGYTEKHPLGGHDPYSASKACAELVSASWYRSFISASSKHERRVGLATARAGNVIGGGDWSEDRLVPDVLRAIELGMQLEIRNPHAVRPWQYVLDPLTGYLMLAQRLVDTPEEFSEPWNFGPNAADARAVKDVVGLLLGHLAPQLRWEYKADENMHETTRLQLDSAKAHSRLGWRPRYSIDQSIDRIAAWHLCEREGGDLAGFMAQELEEAMNGAGSWK